MKPEDVTLPPYYKDTPEARKCMARMLSNVQLMDYQVGEIIKQLKRMGYMIMLISFSSAITEVRCHG